MHPFRDHINIAAGQIVIVLPETSEYVHESLPESPIHKTVRYGIATARTVSQKLKETYGRVAQAVVNNEWIE